VAVVGYRQPVYPFSLAVSNFQKGATTFIAIKP